MLCPTDQARLRAAFYDTALTLFGVFDLHEATPELRHDVADALGALIHDHMWPSPAQGPPTLLYDLRTELELARGAEDEEDE